jgi:ubiquinol-cytochrome c reductase cytochrome b subunit
MRNRWSKEPLLAVVNNHVVDYPTPGNISYLWGFGSLAGICLVIQMVSGIFLAMHYTAHVDLAFPSVVHIMRDVNNGWLVRYLHANGASCFFVVIFSHMLRGLYYGSYAHPRGHLWISGVVILLLSMGTGFLGYVMPWGQMSYWGATVITNLVSVIPFIGEPILHWLWGSFGVENPTLNRFFSFHYTLPFIIAGLVLVHLALLHKDGSTNPLGLDSRTYRIPFYSYFYVKDLFGLILMMTGLSFFVFFYPNALGHPDNFIEASVVVTPPHIVPEWYFLPFYAILRSIPHKLGGVIAMGAAIAGLMALPYINTSEVRSATFRPVVRKLFWIFVVNAFILGFIGQNDIKYPFVEVGQVATAYYFGFLFILLPILGVLESMLMRRVPKTNLN